ncbi:Holliday junction branch migration protein RuvA [Candidatus Poriferisocius sp.]|uniref:Holliday junction branch migration protein RuvA n=1 Tax=Candidatus Poriferisocius sp. TaxID=3101276 RepID=UPI003B0124E2
MIGLLRGTLFSWHRGDAVVEIIVEVAGVGYRVTVSPGTASGLGELNGEVLLHIHHHIREDSQTLYGFPTVEERRAFEALLSAHGVGPMLALSILSVHRPAGLATILSTDDLDALCLIPGVGKKTAARLLVELKARFEIGDVATAVVGSEPTGGSTDARSQVRQALVELGYDPEEIRGAIQSLPAGDNTADLLKTALRHLAIRT